MIEAASISDPRADGGLVEEVLGEYGDAARRTMERYFAADAQSPYLHELMVDYPRRGGKMMRSSLCIAHARAFGSSMGQALATAAAIEMLHNALLIHDDIQDGSETRRGRPTLHVLHGTPLALNAGDMLMLQSLRPLMDNVDHVGEGLAMEVLAETEAMARETAEGQALELGWRDLNVQDVTEADYLRMVLKKTAWFSTIYPARVGALIGSRGRARLSSFTQFAFFLGAAFQIQDDVKNLRPDDRYGKEADGDLWEGKRTLIFIHVQQASDPGDRARIRRMYAAPRAARSAEDVAWLRAAIDRHGSIDHARKVAQALVGAASHEFDRVYAGLPDSRDKRFIAALIPWVLEKS